MSSVNDLPPPPSGIDDLPPPVDSDSDGEQPGFMQRIFGIRDSDLIALSKLPPSFGNYTPGATPAQASLDNPDATKKFAVAGAGLAGGEMLAPLTGGLSGPAGVAARIGTNTAVGDAVQAGNNAVDNKPLTQGMGTSTLIGAGAGALGEGIAGTAGYFSNASADKAAKALGMTKADYIRLGPDKARALGQSAMDQGFIPLFATPAKIEAATDAAKQVAGQKLGQVIDDSQATLDQMPPTGMMPKGAPVQATPVRLGTRLGTPQTQSFYPQAPQTVSPDYSGIDPSQFTPRSINGAPEPTDTQLAQMGRAGSAAQSANLLAAKNAGYDPYAPAMQADVSSVEPAIVRAGPSADFTPIQPRPAGSIDAPALAKQLQSSGDAAQLAKVPGMEGLANKINGFIDTLSKNPQDMTLKQAQSLRQQIDSAVNWGKAVPEMAGTQKYLVNIRNSLSDAMSNAVDQASAQSGSPLGALKAANQNYSKIAQINDIASNMAARNSANRAVGLTDTIAAGAGGTAGASIGGFAAGPIGAEVGAGLGAAAGGGVNKVARTFGPAIQANAYNQAAQIAPNAPRFANAVTVAANINTSGPAPQYPPGNPQLINRTPAVGPDLWAQQGIQKLGINDSGMMNRLLQDPKGKQLLIQASDLAPNSRAMKNIMAQIQKGWGQ